MSGLATRRLIDAAAALEPADRALLNLWINRGLDDARLAELTGVSADALHARRESLVARLSTELGLPAEDVRAALAHITPPEAFPAEVAARATVPDDEAALDDEAVPRAEPSPHAETVPRAEPSPHAETVPHAEAVPHVEAVPGSERRPTAPPRRPRRWPWLAPAALAVLAVAAIAVTAAGGSSPQPRRAAATATSAPNPPSAASASTTSTAPTTSTPATTSVTPPITRRTTVRSADPLIGLPGGLRHASGTVRLSKASHHHRKLRLTVRGLPTPRAGHGEVWLYNSVLDARPVARLRSGERTVTVAPASGARHYRWIDISIQPPGDRDHSGESELRAANPAYAPRARLGREASRARHRARRTARARHRGRRATGHRARRSASGSRRASRS